MSGMIDGAYTIPLEALDPEERAALQAERFDEMRRRSVGGEAIVSNALNQEQHDDAVEA